MAQISGKLAISVHAEFKQQLSILQLFLKINNHDQLSSLRIEVLKDGVHVIHNDSILKVKIQSLKLVPTSCHGLQWSDRNVIHMRLKTEDADIPEYHIRDHGFHSSTKSVALSQKLNGKTISIACGKCDQQFVDSFKFERVLPLPSDNWSSMRDDWFCHCSHKHGNDTKTKEEEGKSEKLLTVTPKTNDLLIGETSLSLNLTNMKNCTQKAKHLQCERCRQNIGSFKENAAQLFMPTIYLSSLTLDSPIRNRSIERFFCDLILSQYKQYNAFRFIIEEETKSVFLVWVLETNCVLYQSEVDSAESNIQIDPEPVTKVLYLDCLREKNVDRKKEWQKNLSVHSLSLPLTSCLELLSILVASTKTLPRSLQSLNGFYVGFLKKTEKS